MTYILQIPPSTTDIPSDKDVSRWSAADRAFVSMLPACCGESMSACRYRLTFCEQPDGLESGVSVALRRKGARDRSRPTAHICSNIRVPERIRPDGIDPDAQGDVDLEGGHP